MEPNENKQTAVQPDLGTIVGDVLGDLAFMVGDEGCAETPAGSAWLECSVSYRGPISGGLRCWCTLDFANQLVANLLGMEISDGGGSAETFDALRELMNVVCGQVVTAWHGADAVFDLSIPVVVECAEAPRPNVQEHRAACELSVSGEPFLCVYDRVFE